MADPLHRRWGTRVSPGLWPAFSRGIPPRRSPRCRQRVAVHRLVRCRPVIRITGGRLSLPGDMGQSGTSKPHPFPGLHGGIGSLADHGHGHQRRMILEAEVGPSVGRVPSRGDGHAGCPLRQVRGPSAPAWQRPARWPRPPRSPRAHPKALSLGAPTRPPMGSPLRWSTVPCFPPPAPASSRPTRRSRYCLKVLPVRSLSSQPRRLW